MSDSIKCAICGTECFNPRETEKELKKGHWFEADELDSFLLKWARDEVHNKPHPTNKSRIKVDFT